MYPFKQILILQLGEKKSTNDHCRVQGGTLHLQKNFMYVIAATNKLSAEKLAGRLRVVCDIAAAVCLLKRFG